MKKVLLFSIAGAIGLTAMAQKDSTRVVDNKGTIKWVISSNAAVITKSDSTLLYVTPKQIGDSSFVKSTNNGLTKTGQTLELGGTLTKPTTIVTDASNNLKITGLQSGNLATDSLVVAASDGTLKRVVAESLLQSGNQFFTATAGQTAYSVTGMPSTASKVWVYRNGAKLMPVSDYTIATGQINFTTAMGALVVAGDLIEVQWIK
jgi:hypothetical protein